MAAGLNRVSLIGNLGKDPEVRHTQSGAAIGNLRIGVTERRKEGEEYKDHTEWISVVCFGKTAENATKYLQKGRQVFVEGRLQTRSWDDKATGQKRFATEVVASQLLFLGSAKDQNSGSSFSRSDNQSFGGGHQDQEEHGGFVEDDDIPF